MLRSFRRIWDGIPTSAVNKLAFVVFIGGTGGLYIMHKEAQRRVRALPCYSEAFEVVTNHKQAMEAIGPPITIGAVDLSDRRRNYIGELESKLRVPISGKLDGGYVNIVARRSSADDDFSTEFIELELESEDNDVFLIYQNPEVTESKPSNHEKSQKT